MYRNWASEPIVFRGHNDSVSSFSVWGQDVISISRNKIGLSSLSRSADVVRIQNLLLYYCSFSFLTLKEFSIFSNREALNLSSNGTYI